MMDLLKFRIPFFAFVIVFFAVVSCKNSEGPSIIENRNNGAALGTSYSIIYFSSKKVDYQEEIDSVFKVINKSMSTYIPTSDISKINKGDSILQVDHMFKDVFNLSKEINIKTDGYFDPTVGVLVNAWGFGPGEQIKLDSSKVDSLLEYVGFGKVELTNAGTIKKTKPSIFFDFNAIAKGYSIDRLGVMLEQKGITNYLVEVGGEIYAKGENLSKRKKWVVGINDPLIEDRTQYKDAVELKDVAMASSGNYRHFRVDPVTKEKYVHTLDPKTGYTKNAKVLAATIITDNCAKADGYATSFMAMDLEDSKKIIENDSSLEAYIVYLDANGEAKDYITDGFKKLILK
ncbi:FAD:protein FMN transferase [Cellulophaga sp. 20_2_10]|uniref:FAD:protein FMN transferase n=1 Tax=Cellulophaga sp. 20_2_10 TaxID=2942476 RepID=UPI00201ABB65|nr:FAD:protein FMN transferase [Cellulophaga sp. 20_2_10]MCL5247109.1 FAD:protein FMN transferase [Cellulophaga sp. 20_2_10]